MIAIALSHLSIIAAKRPAGYEEDVISHGKIEGDILLLEDAVYQDLRKKYSPRLPSLSTQARNAVGAVGRIARAAIQQKKIRVSDEEQQRRMAICATCEFYTGSTCKKCGCHIRFKTKLTTEHCPIGKW